MDAEAAQRLVLVRARDHRRRCLQGVERGPRVADLEHGLGAFSAEPHAELRPRALPESVDDDVDPHFLEGKGKIVSGVLGDRGRPTPRP